MGTASAGLPRGRKLPAELWRTRHRVLLLVLMAHVPLLPLFGLAAGWSLVPAVVAAIPALIFGALAVGAGSQALRSIWMAIGMLSCSAALVVLWHGTTEAHFHYFVMTAALALYEAWVVYGIAVGYVVLQHGLFAHFGGQDTVFAHPMGTDAHGMWFWALVHGGFIAAQSIANLISWRASEDARGQVEAAYATVRHQAEHDPLTGLMNRARFATTLNDALDAREPGKVVAVLFVDLDDFKLVNDALGHGAGDDLLVDVAGRMQHALRPGDALGRFGGDEFIVCLSADSSDAADLVARRLLRAIASTAQPDQSTRRVSATIGVAVADDDTQAEALIRNADAAMYAAKSRGKARIQTYDGRLRAAAIERRSRVPRTVRPGNPARRAPEPTHSSATPEDAAELDRILRSGTIRPVFQPIVDLESRTAVGHEALARGPVGSSLERPDKLFAAARLSGRVADLDWACRAAALRGALSTHVNRQHKVFINIEPGALGSPCPPGFAATWERAGQTLGLVAEITERALTDRPAELLRAVNAFRHRGWGVALDDVGADVRSLALLPLSNPDIIKLDLRLIQAHTSSDIAAIVHTVNAHSERTGALVLAEGIETEAHLATARAMGATLGQGWLFARPAELADDIAAPAHPLALRPPRIAPAGRTPYETVIETVTPRRADKTILLAITRNLESHAAALGRVGVIASAFQTAERFTPATKRRYALLAEDAALVAAFGVGLDAEPAPRVHGCAIADGDALRDEWSVAVIGPHFAAALVAVDRGDRGPDRQRTFDFALTYNRELVASAIESLLVRIDPPRELSVPVPTGVSHAAVLEDARRRAPTPG